MLARGTGPKSQPYLTSLPRWVLFHLFSFSFYIIYNEIVPFYSAFHHLNGEEFRERNCFPRSVLLRSVTKATAAREERCQ